MSRRIRLVAAVATVLVSVGVDTAAGGADRASDVAVIVHRDRPTNAVTLTELRALFTLERQFWPDGTRVVLLLPSSTSSTKQVLLDRVYGITDAALRRFWTARLFQGEIPAIPSSLRSPEAIVAAVRQSRGALAVVPAADVPPDVTLVTIDGKHPGDPGYPLTTRSP